MEKRSWIRGKSHWWSHQCTSFSIGQNDKVTTYVLQGFSLLLDNKCFKDLCVCVVQRVFVWNNWWEQNDNLIFFLMQNLFLHSASIFKKHIFYLREFDVNKYPSHYLLIYSASIHSSPLTFYCFVVSQLWITVKPFIFFTVFDGNLVPHKTFQHCKLWKVRGHNSTLWLVDGEGEGSPEFHFNITASSSTTSASLIVPLWFTVEKTQTWSQEAECFLSALYHSVKLYCCIDFASLLFFPGMVPSVICFCFFAFVYVWI